MKKRQISLVLVSLFALTNLVSCNKENSSSSKEVETTIAFEKNELSLLIGATSQLVVNFTPADFENKNVTWVSSDETVASVDQTGLVTALAVGKTTITATSQADSKLVATCQITVVDNVILASVDAKHEFISFEQNKAKDPTRDDGFYDRTQSYKVGDDNNFNVKPSLTVVDAQTALPVGESAWHYDFNITATIGGQPAGSEYFGVIDARECEVKFTEAAVGKTFTINVAPGGVEASRAASLTKSITVEVVDGYNVYDPKEIGYFDTRVENDTVDAPTMENDQKWQCKWTQFKTANGLNPSYHPAALIFQKDIKVTTADLPSNFFYTAEEAARLGDTKAAGSLVDFTNLYQHTTLDSITVDGNYFSFDLTEIPLVKRDRQRTTDVGKVVSHTAAFKAIRGDTIKFQNINMSGNAKNAVTDDDKVLGGGFIFGKGGGSQAFDAYNIIATKMFITFMGETPFDADGPITKFNLNKVKCYNSYNSFLYNWGSTMTCTDSLFRSCGGPIVIQDHTATDTYESEHGFVVVGNAPTTNFVDCTLENYVNGSEAWFQQFEATALVPQIMALSDLLGATGLTKSFVTNNKHEGKFAAALSAAGEMPYFNFIIFNKSGRAEGMTNVPCVGTACITKSGKTATYNYRQPAFNAVYLAQAAYTAEQSEANLAALLTAATAAKIDYKQDLTDLAEKVQAYLTQEGTIHEVMRGLNGAEPQPAPIFDLGPAFDLLSYDGINPYLQTPLAVYAEMTAGADPVRYVPTADQIAALPDYMAVYYSGMMLVFELTPYVA